MNINKTPTWKEKQCRSHRTTFERNPSEGASQLIRSDRFFCDDVKQCIREGMETSINEYTDINRPANYQTWINEIVSGHHTK